MKQKKKTEHWEKIFDQDEIISIKDKSADDRTIEQKNKIIKLYETRSRCLNSIIKEKDSTIEKMEELNEQNNIIRQKDAEIIELMKKIIESKNKALELRDQVIQLQKQRISILEKITGSSEDAAEHQDETISEPKTGEEAPANSQKTDQVTSGK